jgi:hypothetical protein
MGSGAARSQGPGRRGGSADSGMVDGVAENSRPTTRCPTTSSPRSRNGREQRRGGTARPRLAILVPVAVTDRLWVNGISAVEAAPDSVRARLLIDRGAGEASIRRRRRSRRRYTLQRPSLTCGGACRCRSQGDDNDTSGPASPVNDRTTTDVCRGQTTRCVASPAWTR